MTVKREIWLLAICSAVVTANAYYIHPIIRAVAESFAVSESQVGWVPALNQIALALGVILLLPLGDRVNNRMLVRVCLMVQVLALLVMATSPSFWLFTAASTTLGFTTVTPYLLPAYVSPSHRSCQAGLCHRHADRWSDRRGTTFSTPIRRDRRVH